MGLEIDLQYKPGGQFTHFCANGHQWDDREQLSAALMKMSAKLREKRDLNRTVAAPAITKPDEPIDDRIKIDPIDKERMKSMLGADFSDSSSLFGLIFAQNENIKDLREKVERAEARVMVQAMPRTIGGDVPITVNIPERHVEPIKDIAEAGGMSMERYMQAKIEEGLDNLWYS
jgi:predicted DNA binding CopG/RHH family protein